MNALGRLVKWWGLTRVISLAAVMVSLLHACSTKLDSGGSETNWLSPCRTNADCGVGACVCGVCSAACTTNAQCPGGGGPSVCVTSQTEYQYQWMCGAQSAVDGVCLADCSSAGCSAGSDCVLGTCLPMPYNVPEPEPVDAGKNWPITSSVYYQHVVQFDGASEPSTTLCLEGAVGWTGVADGYCTVLEMPQDPVDCDCAAAGLQVPSEATLVSARLALAGHGLCEGTTDCDQRCMCQLPMQREADACRNDPQASLPPGHCIASLFTNDLAPGIASVCGTDNPHALRITARPGTDRAIVMCSMRGAGTFMVVPSRARDIGEACTPAFEGEPSFAGYVGETAVHSGTPECTSGTCLVHAFWGRTDCPYGQPAPPERAVKTCMASIGPTAVSRLVPPQKIARSPEDAVYCSCQCAGSGPGPFCECPSGFACEPIGNLSNGGADSYCVKAGTALSGPAAAGADCPSQPAPREQGGCGDP